MGTGLIIKGSRTLKFKKCMHKVTILKNQAGFAFTKKNKTSEQKAVLIMSKTWKSDSCSVKGRDKRQSNVARNPDIQQSTCWNEEIDRKKVPHLQWM